MCIHRVLQSFLIPGPFAIKLSGQIFILIALGLQLYVLNGESRLRIDEAEYQASVSHHAHFLQLAAKYDVSNIVLSKAIEVHIEQMQRSERRWLRSAKNRLAKIKFLTDMSVWAAITFILGTFGFAVGEYLAHRRKHHGDAARVETDQLKD